MTILKNTNAHALRFTTKVGRTVQVFNVPAGGEVDVPGDGTGYPKGLVKVRATKSPSKKAKPVKEEPKAVKKEEPKADE